jgi:HK97 gp10 family phage protein
MSADMDLQGFDAIMKQVDDMGKIGDKIYDKALVEAVTPILSEIQATTAFKDVTGKLRKSFKMSKVKKSKDGKVIWVGDVDKVANYSWYREYKTPFLRPAFEKNKKQVFETIKEELRKGLKDNG